MLRRMGRPRGSRDRMGRALRTPHDDRYARAWAAHNVGEAIRAARERQDIAASELAAAVGVSASCVHQWESGRACPTLGRVMRIAWALGVSPSSLLELCE
jgi:ribosome-binding protein aMBF1 (putative translation factor)